MKAKGAFSDERSCKIKNIIRFVDCSASVALLLTYAGRLFGGIISLFEESNSPRLTPQDCRRDSGERTKRS